jgi:signal transduction histidine kinase
VVSREAYRIVQEGLTNVQRHAGLVDTSVRIAGSGDRLVVEVSNAGGPDGGREWGVSGVRRGGRGGHGLDGIRERVELLGGRLSVGPEGSGWALRASVPGLSRPGASR